MNMHLSQIFSSRAHFFPSTNERTRVQTHVHGARQCGLRREEGRRDDDVSILSSTPSNHVSNEPAAARPTFCFLISRRLLARRTGLSFIPRYHHRPDPFFLSTRRASRPLYLSSARRCLISLARWPSRTGRVGDDSLPTRLPREVFR